MRPLQTRSVRTSKPESIQLPINLRDQIKRDGYAIVKGRDFLIPSTLRQSYRDFAGSWNDLSEDIYLQHPGFQRLRRYSHFLYDPPRVEMTLLPSAAYYQSKAVNPLFGGVTRQFAPLHKASVRNSFLNQLIAVDLKQFPVSCSQMKLNWKIGIHQIRVSCRDNQPGLPTPEGVHRDGHSFVVMHLIAKWNVSGGSSKIYREKSSLLQSVTLRAAMDSIFIDDCRVLHDVTHIQPAQRDHAAGRDVLVLTYDCVDGCE